MSWFLFILISFGLKASELLSKMFFSVLIIKPFGLCSHYTNHYLLMVWHIFVQVPFQQIQMLSQSMQCFRRRRIPWEMPFLWPWALWGEFFPAPQRFKVFSRLNIWKNTKSTGKRYGKQLVEDCLNQPFGLMIFRFTKWCKKIQEVMASPWLGKRCSAQGKSISRSFTTKCFGMDTVARRLGLFCPQLSWKSLHQIDIRCKLGAKPFNMVSNM